MAKAASTSTNKLPAPDLGASNGGETHQTAAKGGAVLTTNQGIPISDNQNSLKAGARGPTLLEDFVLREKIMHFDHERIPERIVHARGSAAHGFFEVYEGLADITAADFLQRPGEKTPVFVRFSTVAGNKGSFDLARDVRGFAVKFYTQQGNFDLVGNNMPVFFIQDAIKFPDLVHAAKPEPDREFPQAATAHDTFWDFISLTPESTHMIMWTMSDRAIPRSYRMMEGFGVHTFRLVNAAGEATFAKFHWRPKLGMQSVVWDEAVKINGADPDFHRRDLWETIDQGDVVEFELSLQLFSAEDAASFDFDVLDATKIIPEEVVPLRPVGRLVLDRNPDNFFAETEQVAFCIGNIVPGVDFTDDPLLQGRLFSYLDTQLKRLGGPNFHQIPINQPKCPFANYQRDGHMQMAVPTGRVNYEPNSLAPNGPRETPNGFRTFPRNEEGGPAIRIRPESFADHYTQARLFFRSQTPVEQDHIVAALVFELSRVETPAIRERMVANLLNVDNDLGARVADGLGMKPPKAAPAAVAPRDMELSPALSILEKAIPTFKGRKLGLLVGDGGDAKLVKALQTAVEADGGVVRIVAEKIGGVTLSDGSVMAVDFKVDGGPSCLFDAVAIVVDEAGGARLAGMAAAQAFVKDAYGHLKVIAATEPAMPLFGKAGLSDADMDEGCLMLASPDDAKVFVAKAAAGRIWPREPTLRPTP
ncbi:catalase [Phenylobacterium sp. LH3H17]|uniref:catalase n=1 Tax=Phenylobacterium sp. LH3H17 TaxID=2903901 RepID=UPI0020C97D63|nr:catalase [Phenylobacterium sp. LH3H17]UTP40815.1 catalase [Phenylobacterium sp. LH3H17]